MYSDCESDDLLKNSEQFYQNDEPHSLDQRIQKQHATNNNQPDDQNSEFEDAELQPRQTADFSTLFSEVKELHQPNAKLSEKSGKIQEQIEVELQIGSRPSLTLKAKPITLVPIGNQTNSRTLGQEQLVQMQSAYSPLISTSQKAIGSVIKIPSSQLLAKDSSKYSVEQTSNSDNVSRQNSYQYGDQKSFLDRMGEENLVS